MDKRFSSRAIWMIFGHSVTYKALKKMLSLTSIFLLATHIQVERLLGNVVYSIKSCVEMKMWGSKSKKHRD